MKNNKILYAILIILFLAMISLFILFIILKLGATSADIAIEKSEMKVFISGIGALFLIIFVAVQKAMGKAIKWISSVTTILVISFVLLVPTQNVEKSSTPMLIREARQDRAPADEIKVIEEATEEVMLEVAEEEFLSDTTLVEDERKE